MTRNILLTIEYDGSNFHGWQYQPEVRTVQGELEAALSSALGEQISVNGTSRTDAGVHALGQCASFTTENPIPVDNLKKAVNNVLSRGKTISGSIPGDIRILSCEEVPADFHARFSSKGKTYKYLLSLDPPNSFEGRYCYFVRGSMRGLSPGALGAAGSDGRALGAAGSLDGVPATDSADGAAATDCAEGAAATDSDGRSPAELDIEKMREAASYIVGTHDFVCFQAAGGTPRETTVRTISELTIEPTAGSGGATNSGSAAGCGSVTSSEIAAGSGSAMSSGGATGRGSGTSSGGAAGNRIEIRVSGDGFLYNMVRIIVGTLVEVGQGRRSPESVKAAIDSRDRSLAGHTAPAEGLYLERVYFD